VASSQSGSEKFKKKRKKGDIIDIYKYQEKAPAKEIGMCERRWRDF
jgi:hypothetical protein